MLQYIVKKDIRIFKRQGTSVCHSVSYGHLLRLLIFKKLNNAKQHYIVPFHTESVKDHFKAYSQNLNQLLLLWDALSSLRVQTITSYRRVSTM